MRKVMKKDKLKLRAKEKMKEKSRKRKEEKEENETGTVKRRCEGLISVEALKLLRGRCGELRGFFLGRSLGQS